MHHRKQNNIRTIASSEFRKFCKHSTLHGLYYFSEKRCWMVYAIWTAIIMSSLVLCLFLSQMIWTKFVQDPTFTVVETTHYSTTQISFPAVTVCDTELVYGPNTMNITNILQYRSFNLEQLSDFYESFTKIKKADYKLSDHVNKMHKVLDDLGYSYEVLLEMLIKPCDVLMVQCTWRAKVHDCRNMFRMVHTVFGYCCQFDIKFFKKHANPSTNFVAGVEPSDALSITVNGETTSFNDAVSEGHVSLFVSDATARITTLDYPATVTSAGLFDVSVHVWAIDSTDDVKALSMHTRKCFMAGESSDVHSNHECMSMQVLRKVVHYCRCLPFNYTAETLQVEDFPTCPWERLVCVYHALQKVKSDIKDILYKNDCVQRCDYVHYDTDIEYVRYERRTGHRNESFSNVFVHFSSRTCLKYKRQVIYSWDQLLANLGGIFGLCFGGSIISMIEIVWFVIEVFITYFKVRYTRIPTKKQVFTITKNDLFVMVAKDKIEGKYKFIQ